MSTYNCQCQLWIENIGKLNAPLLFLHARNPGLWEYDGVPFRYCPWCSETLWRDWTDPSVPEAYRESDTSSPFAGDDNG